MQHPLSLLIWRHQTMRGELLKQIPGATGAHLKRDGDDSKVTRKSAADTAGLPECQRKTGLRMVVSPVLQFRCYSAGTYSGHHLDMSNFLAAYFS